MLQYLLRRPSSFIHLYIFKGVLRLIYFIITISIIIIISLFLIVFPLYTHTEIVPSTVNIQND